MAPHVPVFFITSKYPFPADDGQKIPVANYYQCAERSGLAPEIIVVEPGKPREMLGRASEMASRLNPFSRFFVGETLPEGVEERLASCGEAVIFIQPLRLLALVLKAKARNPKLRIIVLTNDAKWPQFREELLYGLNIRKGGTRNDLLKGLMTPVAFLKELTVAYRGADIIALQSERERKKLSWHSKKIVIATNSLAKPTELWRGQDSETFAMQVNLNNRRALKFRPFIEHIWPTIHERAPELTLDLFGPGKTVPGWIAKAPNVRFAGLVEDVHVFLADKRGLIMPLEHDTGVSNTVLHGLALDMPMITSWHSKHGVEHLGYNTPPVYIAKRPEEYVDAVLHAASLTHEATPRALGSWSDNFEAMMTAVRVIRDQVGSYPA